MDNDLQKTRGPWERLLHAIREYLSCIDCGESGERPTGVYGCMCSVRGDKPPGWWTEH